MGANTVLNSFDSFGGPAFRIEYFLGELRRGMMVILATFFASCGLAALGIM